LIRYIVYGLQSVVDDAEREDLRAEVAYLEKEVERLEDELANAKF
jgi:cell division protein FtsB